MKSRLAATVVAALIGLSAAATAGAEDVLKGLRPGHPRLMVLDEDVARVKVLIKSSPTAKAYFQRVREVGDGMLGQPVAQRVLTGPRLLTVSRTVLGRVATLAGLYRLTGERKYADRCRDEMLAAARFDDWNPSHFLDVAEMTNALAIGYDWIHGALSADERAEVRRAIVELGLKPGLKVYGSKNGWHRRTNNWNQVCNGGLTVGALAVADEEPELARRVIEAARASMPLAMNEFAPDGGCVEGPGYWGYATDYTVFYLAALRTALGTDFGFLSSPGFADTGGFRIHSIGPTGRTFNFADGGDGIGGTPQMFWMARALSRPEYAAHERSIIDRVGIGAVGPFHLMWYNPTGTPATLSTMPVGSLYRRIDVALLRTGWDKDAAFVGFKGGDNAASHAHLDLGSFVYDAAGVRWAMDLGGDDYNLPGYWNAKTRWTYYRLGSSGQNTLTLDGANQDPKAKAPITAFSVAGPDRRFAVADLTAAYAQDATRVRRGVRLLPDGRLLVQDEVEARRPIDLVWHMHTAAAIAVADDGRSATLTQSGKRLRAKVLSPSAARFEIAESDPPPAVESTVPTGRVRKPGTKLTARLTEKAKDVQLVIVLEPEGSNHRDPSVTALNAWGGVLVK